MYQLRLHFVPSGKSGRSPSPLHPVTPSAPRLSRLAPPLRVHETISSRCGFMQGFQCVRSGETHTHIATTEQLQTCDTLLCSIQDGPGTIKFHGSGPSTAYACKSFFERFQVIPRKVTVIWAPSRDVLLALPHGSWTMDRVQHAGKSCCVLKL